MTAKRAQWPHRRWSWPFPLRPLKGSAGPAGHSTRPESYVPVRAPTLLRSAGPIPISSAPATAALLGLAHAARRHASGRLDLAGLLRGATMAIGPETDQPLGKGTLTVPVSEQAVWAYNATSTAPLVAAYSSAPGSSLDYPMVVTNGAPATTRDAADLLAALSSGSGRLLLQSRGFRDQAGRPGPALRKVEGIEASAAVSVRTPSMDDLSTARGMLGTLGRGSRILAVVDVSSSMAEHVPGSGLTRLDVTVEAASAGLSLLPARSEAGLWEFSTDLGPDRDYRGWSRSERLPVGMRPRWPRTSLVSGRSPTAPPACTTPSSPLSDACNRTTTLPRRTQWCS